MIKNFSWRGGLSDNLRREYPGGRYIPNNLNAEHFTANLKGDEAAEESFNTADRRQLKFISTAKIMVAISPPSRQSSRPSTAI